MIEIVRRSDYVVVSEEFSKDLGCDLTVDSLARERRNLKIRVLTITMGEEGSITASDNNCFHVPAFRVKAIDTTGAGDVFHGGYIYGLLQRWDLRETVVFASALAALKCTEIGGRAGIPGLEEVKRFLYEHDPDFSP
jgi:ribokinase